MTCVCACFAVLVPESTLSIVRYVCHFIALCFLFAVCLFYIIVYTFLNWCACMQMWQVAWLIIQDQTYMSGNI